MKTICVYLGSNAARETLRIEHAIILAKTLVYNDYHAVYGGTGVGLLGMLVDAVPGPRGRSNGVFQESIIRRAARGGLSGLIVARDRHERQRRMFEISDAFMARPGGYGTPEKAFELLPLARRDRRRRPIAFFTIADYYGHLARFLNHAEHEGLIRPEHRRMTVIERDAEELLRRLRELKIPANRKRMA